jgi:hypothetical protein
MRSHHVPSKGLSPHGARSSPRRTSRNFNSVHHSKSDRVRVQPLHGHISISCAERLPSNSASTSSSGTAAYPSQRQGHAGAVLAQIVPIQNCSELDTQLHRSHLLDARSSTWRSERARRSRRCLAHQPTRKADISGRRSRPIEMLQEWHAIKGHRGQWRAATEVLCSARCSERRAPHPMPCPRTSNRVATHEADDRRRVIPPQQHGHQHSVRTHQAERSCSVGCCVTVPLQQMIHGSNSAVRRGGTPQGPLDLCVESRRREFAMGRWDRVAE